MNSEDDSGTSEKNDSAEGGGRDNPVAAASSRHEAADSRGIRPTGGRKEPFARFTA